MEFRAVPTTILFATILLMMFVFPLPVNADCGPSSEDLIIRFYLGVESAYTALKACEIDAIGYGITADLYADAITDPNICLGPVSDRGFYEIDMNGNYTIEDHRDYENPMWGKQGIPIRKAITHLLNKDFIVSDCCGGFANRIDQQIAYVHRSWRSQSCWYEDGTGRDFDPLKAAKILNGTDPVFGDPVDGDPDGFPQGTTPNPYYDPTFPGSAPFIRTYPARHPKAGQDLDPLKYLIRTDDLRRTCAGDLHTANLRKHGIPINVVYGPSSALYPIVMDDINYHLYTGSWNASRFPPEYVYNMFHSSNFILGGSNYVTGNDSNNQPNYPIVDYWLNEARFPPDKAASQAALKQALELLWCQYCVNIPMYSTRSYWAWKSDLKGVVVGDGDGLENNYFFYNCYKAGGGPLVYGLIAPPNQLNIIYSTWYFDYQVLDRIYETGGPSTAPYDLDINQTGYLKEWTVSPPWWYDDDDEQWKTLVTRTWRSECPGNPGEPLHFTLPVTGAQGEILDVKQHYANLWYIKQTPDAWAYHNNKDVKTTRMIGDYSLEIYWNTNIGYWPTYYGTTYIMPFHVLRMGTISYEVTEPLNVDSEGWTETTGPAFWIISADDTPGPGGTPLVVGTDLDMYLDTSDTPGPHKCTIRVINPAYYGTTIEVTYDAAGDAHGYTPGNLGFLSLEGHGQWYITDLTPGVGGSVTLKKNPRYYAETRPLGEIDFIRKSGGPPTYCPDTFKIDIYDIVIAASAYMTQGCYIPDDNWFPGADLTPAPDGICRCQVNIYDIVTIAGRYGEEFDCDP